MNRRIQPLRALGVRCVALLGAAYRCATGRPSEFWPMTTALLAMTFHLAAPGSGDVTRPQAAGRFPAFEAPPVEEPAPRKVSVTGYSSTPDQTDDTPFLTAYNTRVRPGIVALSRDLLREYTPGAPFGFGDRVEIVGVGTFHVEDTMASRFRNRVDIWFETRSQAKRWGKRMHGLLPAPSPDEGDLAWRPPASPVELPAASLFQAALSD